VRLWEHVPLDDAKTAVIAALGFTPGAAGTHELAAAAGQNLGAEQALAEIPQQMSHHETAPATREGG